MPGDVVRDIAADGAFRQKTSSNVGPADRFSSEDLINDDGVLTEEQNQGTAVARIYGDGRQWGPILTAPPPSPVNGQFWLELDGGITEIKFVDHTGTVQTLGTGSAPPTPTITNLITATPVTLASISVDSVGTIEWSLNLYKEATADRYHFRLVGAHDGTTGSDATGIQLSQQGTIAFGTNDVVLALVLSGVGPAQVMELQATAGSGNWKAALVAERMVSP